MKGLATGGGAVCRFRRGVVYVVAVLVLAIGSSSAEGREVFVSGSAPGGGDGSKEAPFATLGAALAIAGPGDTVRVSAGTYRETVRPVRSGEPGRPLRIEAEAGATVTVTGTDPIPGVPIRDADGRLRLPLADDPRQVFCGGTLLTEARWPNAAPAGTMGLPRAAAGPGTDYDGILAPDLPSGDWNGALVRLWPGDRWTNSTRRITDYRPGVGFRFDRDFRPQKADPYHLHDPFKPREGNPYILFGVPAALDAPGEWCWDAGAGLLTAIPPVGMDLDLGPGVLEVRVRDTALDLSGLAHVRVAGLRIRAGAVDMRESRECVLEDCVVSHSDTFRETDRYEVPESGNVMSGRDNAWIRCLIEGSEGTGLRVRGEGNRIERCVIRDTNRSGSNASALCLNDSVGTVAERCTILRSGRSLIRHYRAKRIRIVGNDLSRANILTNDCGATYAWGTDGEGSEIAGNLVHDNTGDHTVGIYLDNFSSNFRVHHNILWNNSASGICLNSDALGHLVANNTILSDRAFSVFTYAGRTPTQAGTRVLNNLVIGRLALRDPGWFVQGDLAPEVRTNGTGAIDSAAVPTADSAARDAGVEIPGITDGFVGAAPDLGALEFGGTIPEFGAGWGEIPARPDFAYTPRGPITAETMVRDGLVLWLDAADADSLQAGPDGAVSGWADKSPRGTRVAVGAGFRVVPGGRAGKSTVRGTGQGALVAGALRDAPGAATVFLVTGADDAEGGPWQRLIGAWSGTGDEWVKPNWTVVRPGGETVRPFAWQVFVRTEAEGVVLNRVTIGGSSCGGRQFLAGEIGEVLIFSRKLGSDDVAAIEAYLTTKWGIAE